MTAIRLDGVTKRYGDVTAVNDLSLDVKEGEVFGFLGPNGAGKSTTIDLVLDFIRPTSGTVTVLGHDAQAESIEIRNRTGVLPEGFSVYDRLTGMQHLEFAIEAKDADDDPAELLDRVDILDAADRKAGGYSKGMAQRLGLAMALVGTPDLLILDEPSSGLDPTGAREMREIIREEQERGATVFFSSHILGQVEAVCDRVGILRDGELVAEDSIEGLRANVGDGTTLRVETTSLPSAAVQQVRDIDGVGGVERDGETLTVDCDRNVKTTVITTLENAGATVADFDTEEASLEDLFVAYTRGGVTA
ncbi:copper ABC transporter ATP-binding protein [Haladaptatus paucihalophilus DX253]|uniref:ABC-2 type transport system ATP-binding protein n=1 Tax=Haladaptatus paucihalophilus DX253 TaxID=797209 RepID=E7QN54_HALPU|nr:ABC transporter ATP-binding protein [Haladaptatus paucihalophilus]EFW93849.1 copper ABC transporter ATP-binding protein [Haladaptatus paucihalophilus DX253]SHL53098.1 ABC-2 type transport system ATP-binding protein [Haladaptatus paucihalophilus DX253]